MGKVIFNKNFYSSVVGGGASAVQVLIDML